MTQHPHPSTAALWARFRFSVVGSLLSSPPARGELRAAIRSLSAKGWTHPVTGRETRFAAGTDPPRQWCGAHANEPSQCAFGPEPATGRDARSPGTSWEDPPHGRGLAARRMTPQRGSFPFPI